MKRYLFTALLFPVLKFESALSRALSERREFSTEERRRVAEILDFDVEWLFAVAMLPTTASKTKELSSARGAHR